MQKIIEIRGTQCSGKSWACENVKDLPHVSIFDMLDFYNQNGCIVNGKMDWEKWDACIKELPQKLRNFIADAGDNLIIIEHASNGKINQVLRDYEVETLVLKTPDEETIKQRAKQRNLSEQQVINFRNKYMNNYVFNKMQTLTAEEARIIIEKRAELNSAKIHYLSGSALKPQTNDNAIIAHVCNDIGGWGSGFVVAISNTWPEPERSYRQWHKSGYMFQLGTAQLVKVTDKIHVANMIAQEGTISSNPGSTPIRYDALKQCLNKLAYHATKNNATIHMPRIGCGLAGGNWSKVEEIIKETLIVKNVDVYVYTLPNDNSWKD